LLIDTTLAGRAFQSLQVQIQQQRPSRTVAWVPLLDGTERLGALAVTLSAPEVDLAANGLAAQRLRTFASLLAELIATRTLHGDTIVRTRRTSPMGLAAETQWSLLPPLTFACEDLTVAAVLEPAYEVAGDTVDYAVDGHMARVAVFDGMGHGLASAQLASMAVTAYRHARRVRYPLPETATHIDQVLLKTFAGSSFTTALLAELDTASGAFTWINAGHPEPLLLRNGRLVKTLHVPPRPPLGIVLPADVAGRRKPHSAVEHLEPGDCVLLYTDGVTEARSPDGNFFGEQRLADLIVRNLAAGLPAPETMRRVVRALLEHQQGRLDDDATLLLLQWPTDRPGFLS
jgi:serine phosphatase RsbU (regulator of sigma subunit)